MATLDHDQEFVQLLTDHQSAIPAYIRSLMPGYPGARDMQQHTNDFSLDPTAPKKAHSGTTRGIH